MRKRTQLVESGRRGAPRELVDNASSDGTAACLAAHSKGPHFRHRAAQRREFRTRQDLLVLYRDDEAMRVKADLFEVTRKQMPFREMLVDQVVDRVGLVSIGGPDLDRRISDATRANREPRTLANRTPNPSNPEPPPAV